ncbi:glycosyltransferase family 4 protein [Geodermatophilus sp. SYSU D00742]
MATRITAVIPANTFGGAHNQIMQLQEHLHALGYETTVVLPREPGNAERRLSSAGVRTVLLPLRRPRAGAPASWFRYLWGFPHQVRRLARLFRAQASDLVQAHGLLQLDVALAARITGKPLVWQLLDTRPPVALRAALVPLMYLLSSVVMTTGTTTARSYGLSQKPRSMRPVIPFFPPVPTSALDQLPQPPVGRVTFGCLANMNPQKGLPLLIQAFEKSGVTHDARLLLQGPVPPGHESIPGQLEELRSGLAVENVEIRTHQADVVEFLSETHVLVMGSEPRSEGTPTVILEAMWAGRPVIATRVGGIPELVQHGTTGFLVDPGDAASMGRYMAQLVDQHTRREGMGAAARREARLRFSTEATLAAYADAYQAALRRAHT